MKLFSVLVIGIVLTVLVGETNSQAMGMAPSYFNIHPAGDKTMCLAPQSGHGAWIGTSLVITPCDNDTDQLWSYSGSATKGSLLVWGGDGALCVDIGATVFNGVDPELNACSSSFPTQQWTHPTNLWSYIGWCLSYHAPVAGTVVVVTSCGQWSNQQWL